MPTLSCPHCGKRPATGLHRFLPLTKLVRETFVCSLCGQPSEFSANAERWSIAAGAAAFLSALITLRLVRAWQGINHIPMSTLAQLDSLSH